MNPKASFVFFLIFLLSFFISLFLSSCSPEKVQNTHEEDLTELTYKLYPESPFEVVNQFCEHLVALQAQKANGSEDLMLYLSNEAQTTLQPYSGKLAYQLARLASEQQLPDQGFHIMGVIDINPEYADVEVRWNYTKDHEKGTATVKVFRLIQEDDRWKINHIH